GGGLAQKKIWPQMNPWKSGKRWLSAAISRSQ
ncbi:hypothetical protein EYB31_39885, partial [Paenibacillus thalictri]